MKIYDISQELLSSKVFDGDPIPRTRRVKSMEDGELYNLTELSMCVHNGTHIDAPRHFIRDGADVASVSLERTVGFAFVAECECDITASVAGEILARARSLNPSAALRLLIKGNAVLLIDGARVFAEAGVCLVGVESQSVGDENAPMAVHIILLESEVVLLEGLRLNEVGEGVYFLAAQPLSIKNSDGAPTRAILIEGLC